MKFLLKFRPRKNFASPFLTLMFSLMLGNKNFGHSSTVAIIATNYCSLLLVANCFAIFMLAHQQIINLNTGVPEHLTQCYLK